MVNTLISLSDSEHVRDALADMMAAALGFGAGGYDLQPYSQLADALLVIECAKRAEDNPEWFPRGKWATIQSIQGRVDAALNALFPSGGEE